MLCVSNSVIGSSSFKSHILLDLRSCFNDHWLLKKKRSKMEPNPVEVLEKATAVTVTNPEQAIIMLQTLGNKSLKDTKCIQFHSVLNYSQPSNLSE